MASADFVFCFRNIFDLVMYITSTITLLVFSRLLSAKVKLICLFRKLSTRSVRKRKLLPSDNFRCLPKGKPCLKMIRGVCSLVCFKNILSVSRVMIESLHLNNCPKSLGETRTMSLLDFRKKLPSV